MGTDASETEATTSEVGRRRTEEGGAKGAIRRAHAALSGADASDDSDDSDAGVKVEADRQHRESNDPNTETKEGFGL